MPADRHQWARLKAISIKAKTASVLLSCPGAGLLAGNHAIENLPNNNICRVTRSHMSEPVIPCFNFRPFQIANSLSIFFVSFSSNNQNPSTMVVVSVPLCMSTTPASCLLIAHVHVTCYLYDASQHFAIASTHVRFRYTFLEPPTNDYHCFWTSSLLSPLFAALLLCVFITFCCVNKNTHHVTFYKAAPHRQSCPRDCRQDLWRGLFWLPCGI
jgi:hypothetical protein